MATWLITKTFKNFANQMQVAVEVLWFATENKQVQNIF